MWPTTQRKQFTGNNNLLVEKINEFELNCGFICQGKVDSWNFPRVEWLFTF